MHGGPCDFSFKLPFSGLTRGDIRADRRIGAVRVPCRERDGGPEASSLHSFPRFHLVAGVAELPRFKTKPFPGCASNRRVQERAPAHVRVPSPRPRDASFLAPKSPHSCLGEPRSPPPARGPTPCRANKSASRSLGSHPLGVALARVRRVARGAHHREAGHGRSLAPGRFPMVLASRMYGVARAQVAGLRRIATSCTSSRR
jgi:hypothetical protein